MLDKIEKISKICHQANKAYCESIGDFSQPDWDKAPDWQKESARAGVVFHLHNPDFTPSDSHNSWFDHKLKDGWKYGPVKDVDKKEHPCMVNYSELPLTQRKKDSLFLAIVRALE